MVQGKECDTVLTNVMREDSVEMLRIASSLSRDRMGKNFFFSFTIVISGTNTAFLSL